MIIVGEENLKFCIFFYRIIYFTDKLAGNIEKLKLENTSRNTIIANPDAVNPVHMDLGKHLKKNQSIVF